VRRGEKLVLSRAVHEGLVFWGVFEGLVLFFWWVGLKLESVEARE